MSSSRSHSSHQSSPTSSPKEHLAPRKDLGQNFLQDANVARNIVQTLEIQASDVIIEIGPGEGALTKLLLQSELSCLILVEFDARAVDFLERHFQKEIQSGRVRIFHRDILRTTAAELLANIPELSINACVKLIGNIPYYITSDILFWLFGEWAQNLKKTNNTTNTAPTLFPERAVIMMQKEVAERIVAKQRTKEYGILSVASALVSTPKVRFNVSPKCFFPPPKVISSVVEFRMKTRSEDAEAFLQTQALVRAAFNQRRKMLSNALGNTLSRVAEQHNSQYNSQYNSQHNSQHPSPEKELSPAIIIKASEERGFTWFRARAEELSAQDFIQLGEFLRAL